MLVLSLPGAVNESKTTKTTSQSPNPVMAFGNSCLDGISYQGNAAHKCSPVVAIRPIMHVPCFILMMCARHSPENKPKNSFGPAEATELHSFAFGFGYEFRFLVFEAPVYFASNFFLPGSGIGAGLPFCQLAAPVSRNQEPATRIRVRLCVCESACVCRGNPGQPRTEPPAIAISVLINFFDCQMQSWLAGGGSANDLRSSSGRHRKSRKNPAKNKPATTGR